MITLTGTVLLLCNHRNLIIVRCKFDETIVHRSCTDFLLGGASIVTSGFEQAPACSTKIGESEAFLKSWTLEITPRDKNIVFSSSVL